MPGTAHSSREVLVKGHSLCSQRTCTQQGAHRPDSGWQEHLLGQPRQGGTEPGTRGWRVEGAGAFQEQGSVDWAVASRRTPKYLPLVGTSGHGWGPQRPGRPSHVAGRSLVCAGHLGEWLLALPFSPSLPVSFSVLAYLASRALPATGRLHLDFTLLGTEWK